MAKKIKTQKIQPDVPEEQKDVALAVVEVIRTGRPPKYEPRFCQKIIDWFNVPHSRKEIKKQGTRNTVHKNGTETNAGDVEYIYIPNELPTFGGFARSIGVIQETVTEWVKNYPDFSVAYNTAKILQAEFLMDNALRGLYPPATFIFIAKNITDMRDKVEITDTRETERLDQMQKDLYELLNPGKAREKEKHGKQK